MPVVVAEDVRKSFGSLTVLDGVSLSVSEGELIAVIGRSGSGKSTFLRCLNGLETPDSGQIIVAGHALAPGEEALRALRQDVGMVFQSYNLFPHLTVGKNIELAPRLVKKIGKAEASDIARSVLAEVGLAEKYDAFPEQLSGGQQQRVAIARSLAMRPKVMLFDEVTSALDPELTGEVLKVMEGLSRSGMTMLLVTHEMAFARKAASRVVYFHQGRIHEQGPPEEFFGAPKTPELQQFLGAVL
ncbi:amino acid ABC transporter ATP-binding protein [Bosea sp. 2KB_26]|uniref:amino acid ABC transporter ATP-binding protein n=1 Tax=unclassified Bosea (in: a-proteobacteria) TaxID=2653178 RepID=UPI0008531987|nr:amino acid ABC transporter ATP-binding protein [Bosea sp. BIWAKO-01]GAU81416.1 glutamine transport ATP-binding protein GlnQ [Bosea sp. BIWAKO-01]